MTDEELREFLAEQMIMNCATLGPNGRPHLISLWYVPDGATLSGWTYAKSQKTRNLERDPRATVQVEDGVQYHELRGAMLECDVELERDSERVADVGMALFARYADGAELPEGTRDMVLAQAAKRVGLRFVPTRIVTWDHGKLGGVY